MGLHLAVAILSILNHDVRKLTAHVFAVIADPDGAISAVYKNIARQVAIRVANLSKDMSSKFPNIVVQNT